MCENKNLSCECIYDILQTILNLQQFDDNCCMQVGCDKPYLGPEQNVVCYNTRPISLYNCCTGNLWQFPYTLNDQSQTSTVFRIESLDNCCATFRILYTTTDGDTTTYNGTNEFFTINLNCVSAIKCYADTFIDLC